MKTKEARRKMFYRTKTHKRESERELISYHPFLIMGLAVVLLFSGICVASATDYYVATGGSDSNNGTLPDYPWQHPSYAAQQAQAGDTIFLLDGTWYDEHVVFANSGNATHPITITSYNGTPTLDGIDDTGYGISTVACSYIDIVGNIQQVRKVGIACPVGVVIG